MIIGLDAKRAYLNDRGLGNYSRSLIQGLLEYQKDNEYLLFTPHKGQKSFEDWGDHKVLTSPIKILGSLWRTFSISDLVSKNNCDLYHGLTQELPRGMPSSVKKVVTIHDMIPFRDPHFFPWPDRHTYKWKVRHAIETADLVLAICEQTKKDIHEYLQVPDQKVKVHYQSFRSELLKKWSEDQLKALLNKFKIQSPYIFYVGALVERKRAHLLFKAFKKISSKIPHQLIIAGRGGDYQKQLEQMIKDSALEKRVHLIGHVGDKDLPGLYQGASLIVNPSCYEGWGIPNVEAAASKTPLLSSNSPALVESAGPHAHFFEVDNQEELEDRLLNILNEDTSKTRETIEKSFKYAMKFHIPIVIENLFRFYQEV